MVILYDFGSTKFKIICEIIVALSVLFDVLNMRLSSEKLPDCAEFYCIAVSALSSVNQSLDMNCLTQGVLHKTRLSSVPANIG